MKKGVSIIIALVLMIMITVAAAAAAFYWLAKVQGEMQSGTERSQAGVIKQATGEITIKRFKHDSLIDTFEIIIENSGSRSIENIGAKEDTVTIYNQELSCTFAFNDSYCDVCPFDLGTGALQVINLDTDGTDCQNIDLGTQYSAYISSSDIRAYASFISDIHRHHWTEKTFAVFPKRRAQISMASIDGTDKVLLFGGGLVSDMLNNTWIYDYSDNNWTNMSPASRPLSGVRRAMASIDGTDKVLLFGGGYSGMNETWIYNYSDNNWYNMTPPGSPPQTSAAPFALYTHALATIYGTYKVLMHYGSNDWIYNYSDNTWTDVTTASTPAASYLASIDNTDKVVSLTGTWSSPQTWVYDYSDNNWTNMSPIISPYAGSGVSLSTIKGTDRILFFGGYASLASNETWIYDYGANTWTYKTIDEENVPPEVLCTAMAPIDGTNKVLLFGGATETEEADVYWKNETWIFE